MRSATHPFLYALCRAGLALVASALILLATFVAYTASEISTDGVRQLPMVIPGKAMQVMVGRGEASGEHLALTADHPEGDKFTAVAVWRGRFQAADYPLLHYRVDRAFPGTAMTLIWRTAENPQQLKHIDMQASERATSWLRLDGHPDWQGTVEELGVYIFAAGVDQTLSIAHLTLAPLSWRGGLASQWSSWTSLRGWSARSINYLYGTASRDVLSPVVVAGAWSALAVGLLLVAALFGWGWQTGALATVLLLPWISLDLLWQKELLGQLTQTRLQFAGKTAEQKHLAAVDAHIYRYIMRLKGEALPVDPARIVILHSSKGHNFDRLRAQYYLLPHNVYNFGMVPPSSGMDGVDYVLVLGAVAGLEFQTQTSTLIWRDGGRSLAVEQVDSDPMGRLYRVVHKHPVGDLSHD